MSESETSRRGGMAWVALDIITLLGVDLTFPPGLDHGSVWAWPEQGDLVCGHHQDQNISKLGDCSIELSKRMNNTGQQSSLIGLTLT